MSRVLPLLTLLLLFGSSCSMLPSIEGVREKESHFRVAWSKNNDPTHQTGNLPIALNSPLIHDGILYVGHNAGYMVAYELGNGREIWREKDKGAYHASPVYYKDHIIYGTNQGRVYARHTLTGKIKYSIDLDASVESTAVVHKGRLFFHLRNHKIFCLDVETGKVLWAYKRSVPFLTTLQRVSRPLLHKNRLYVGFADGHVAAFNMEDGMLLWERRLSNGNKFIDVDQTPVLKGKKLYISSMSGLLTILDADTGGVIRKVNINISRAPILEDERVLVGTTEGELVWVDSNFKEMKKLKLSESSISSITPWKGKLAVSTVSEEIFLVDQKELKLIDTFYLGHSTSAVFGSLQEDEGVLAALSSRNRLYVFR